MNLQAIREKVKSHLRLVFLSFVFFVGTTFISVVFIWLTSVFGKETVLDFNLGATIIGSFVGQVVLLLAMSLISRIFREQRKDIAKEIIETIDKINDDEE